MTESKIKRLIVALTSGAVLFMAILVSVLVYQLVSIKVARNEIKELEKQIAIYTELTEDKKSTLSARRQKWWIERRARELGYKFPDDIDLGGIE